MRAQPQTSVGPLLRQWRERRKMSQLGLATEAELPATVVPQQADPREPNGVAFADGALSAAEWAGAVARAPAAPPQPRRPGNAAMELPDEAVTYNYQPLPIPLGEEWTVAAEMRSQQFLHPAKFKDLAPRLTQAKSQAVADREARSPTAEALSEGGGFIDVPQNTLDNYRRKGEASELGRVLEGPLGDVVDDDAHRARLEEDLGRGPDGRPEGARRLAAVTWARRFRASANRSPSRRASGRGSTPRREIASPSPSPTCCRRKSPSSSSRPKNCAPAASRPRMKW